MVLVVAAFCLLQLTFALRVSGPIVPKVGNQKGPQVTTLVQMINWDNPNDNLPNGAKCDPGFFGYHKCDPFFLCTYQADDQTIYQSYNSDSWEDIDHVTFGTEHSLNMTTAVGASINLNVVAWDEDFGGLHDKIGTWDFTHTAVPGKTITLMQMGGFQNVMQVAFTTFNEIETDV